MAKEANKTIEGHTSEKRKSPHVLTLQADVNSLYGKALLELGRVEESIVRHKEEIKAAKKSGIDEIKIRAMDNLAVSFFSIYDFFKPKQVFLTEKFVFRNDFR